MQPIKVIVSGDRMAAFVLIAPGCDAGAQDIRDALKREGVVEGISPKAVQEAVTGDKGLLYQVARGIPPAGATENPSHRPTLVFNYANSKGRPADTFSAGPGFRASWQRLRARGAVNAGDLVAYVRSPLGLRKALAVTGEEVPFVELDPHFMLGANTKFSHDGLKIVATRPGIPYVDAEGAGVLDHVAIEGNVGLQTGNLSFPGDLTVRGNVESGFSVSVSGDLLVGGHVWGSATARGKMMISGGIAAPGEMVEAGGGISCRFCENSVVRSSGPIAIQEAVIHSVVETEDTVSVTGAKGRIVGGMIRATVSLEATTVGTPIGVPTIVELGISPRLRREQARLEREFSKVSADLANTRRSGGCRLSGMSDLDLMRMARARRHLEDQVKALSDRLESLNEKFDGMPKGYFQAERVLPGTRLLMGTDVHEFTSSIDRIIMGVRNA